MRWLSPTIAFTLIASSPVPANAASPPDKFANSYGLNVGEDHGQCIFS